MHDHLIFFIQMYIWKNKYLGENGKTWTWYHKQSLSYGILKS